MRFLSPEPQTRDDIMRRDIRLMKWKMGGCAAVAVAIVLLVLAVPTDGLSRGIVAGFVALLLLGMLWFWLSLRILRARLDPRAPGAARIANGPVARVMDWCRDPFGLVPWVSAAIAIGSLAGGWYEHHWASGARAWPAVPCTITRAEIIPGSGEHAFTIEVAYHYEIAGHPYQSSTFSNQSPGGSYREETARLNQVDADDPHCLVEPGEPTHAYLIIEEEYAPWGLAGIFVVITALLAVGAWWRRRGILVADRPWSDAGTHAVGARVLAIAIPVMATAWIIVAVVQVAVPLMRCLGAGDWVATPCSIDATAMSIVDIKGVPFYAPVIDYSYRAGGEPHQSETIDFSAWTITTAATQQKLIDDHAVGFAATCYVDPRDPTRSVLTRSLRFSPLDALLLLFGACVVGGMAWRLRKLRTPLPLPAQGARRERADAPPVVLALRADNRPKPIAYIVSPVVLAWSAWAGIDVVNAIGVKFDGVILIDALMVLFIATLYVVAIVSAWRHGGPAPVLTMSGGRLAAGGSVDIAWTVPGAIDRQSWTLIIEGHEKGAIIRKINTGHGNTEVKLPLRRCFHRQTLATIRAGGVEGSCALALPAPCPPTFDADLVSITWVLVARNDAGAKREYPLVILPAETP